MNDAPDTIDDEGAREARRLALSACVARMKELGLTGKLRDDAAGHFLAGVAAVVDIDLPATPIKYLDVLEALAD